MVARTAGFAAALALAGGALAEPFLGDAGPLPAGTDLGQPALEVPRQILTVERQGGQQNFLIALGNLAFSSPELMGGLARRAGISCNTCHVSGETNPVFFLPGLSSRPGTVDVSGPQFNHAFDDGVLAPLDIPSLRGIRQTAPYGRDGREASLHAFTRNVVVNEFAGDEPTPVLLDALVVYMQQFEFLPNPKLGPAGRLAASAQAAARRGEVLFHQPFEGMGGQSCASCHLPSALFLDRRAHDVGTGDHYDTPTLLNARFTAPYFHDGRASTLGAVIAHFDRTFGLDLTASERTDLLAYLQAIGDGREPTERKDFAFDMAELEIFTNLLDVTLERRDAGLTRLIVDTVNGELREIGGRWFRPKDRGIRATVAGWAIQLRRVATHAQEGEWRAAARALAAYRERLGTEAGKVAAAEQRSLYAADVLTDYLRDVRHLSTQRASPILEKQ